jgi:16S rRNA processing protein RimM
MEQLIVVSGRELAKIGKLTSTVGIRGGVKITPLFFISSAELLDILLNYAKDLYLYSDGAFPKKLTLTSHRLGKGTIAASFDEITDIKEAKNSLGRSIVIDRKDYDVYLKKTDSMIKYIGYSVEDINLGRIGEVANVSRKGQKLLIIDDGTRDGKLVPFVPEFIESIDDEKKCVKTNLPEGIFG